jgi:hypothetical protein
VRRVGIDVRHHDDDVARAQRGVGVAGGEQLVVEDLDLALRTVGDMEADRASRAGSTGRPVVARLGQGAQLEDVVLQLLQQGRRRVGLNRSMRWPMAAKCLQVAGARRLLVVLVEQADEIAPLLAPGGQQGLRVQVQQFSSMNSGALPPLLAVRPCAQQVRSATMSAQ